MDTIAALSPDLIVPGTDRPPAAVKQLRKVAPVLEVRSVNASDAIGQMPHAQGEPQTGNDRPVLTGDHSRRIGAGEFSDKG